MSHQKNEVTAILCRRERAIRLRIRGNSYQQIANQLGISKGTAFNDIRAVHEEWTHANLDNMEIHKRTELTRLEEVEREAWEQWERSKSASKTETSGRDPVPPPKSADVRFLGAILKCVEQRRKILGLDAPVRSALSHTVESGPQPGEGLYEFLRAKLADRGNQVPAN